MADSPTPAVRPDAPSEPEIQRRPIREPLVEEFDALMAQAFANGAGEEIDHMAHAKRFAAFVAALRALLRGPRVTSGYSHVVGTENPPSTTATASSSDAPTPNVGAPSSSLGVGAFCAPDAEFPEIIEQVRRIADHVGDLDARAVLENAVSRFRALYHTALQLADEEALGVGDGKRVPAYYCRACPEVFYDADSSNRHHDATGHNQTWRSSQAFGAARVSDDGADMRVTVRHREMVALRRASDGCLLNEEEMRVVTAFCNRALASNAMRPDSAPSVSAGAPKDRPDVGEARSQSQLGSVSATPPTSGDPAARVSAGAEPSVTPRERTYEELSALRNEEIDDRHRIGEALTGLKYRTTSQILSAIEQHRLVIADQAAELARLRARAPDADAFAALLDRYGELRCSRSHGGAMTHLLPELSEAEAPVLHAYGALHAKLAAAEQENAALKADAERLRGQRASTASALAIFGQHRLNCKWTADSISKCSCGYLPALIAARSTPIPATADPQEKTDAR